MMSNFVWRRMMGAWVWIKRIRHRCGYGVHSPFAFDFITNVIYEKTPYYAYEELEKEVRLAARVRGAQWRRGNSRKVRRLLFRVVNRVQPDTLLYVGPDSPVIPFLKAPRRALRCWCLGPQEALPGQGLERLDMLVLNLTDLEGDLERWWRACVPFLHSGSVVVIRGVGASGANRRCWEWLKRRPETGISFDLYEVGIVFMDHDKIKQHYVVNF